MFKKINILSKINNNYVIKGLSYIINNKEVKGLLIYQHLIQIIHVIFVSIHNAAFKFVT